MPLNPNRRPGLRPAVLALFAALSLLFGLLAPVSPAAAAVTFKAPTSVSAAKISGSHSLKVTWKAAVSTTVGDASVPEGYRVFWGKSSTFSKASSGFTTVPGNSTLPYVINSLSAATYYYVWVVPYSADGKTATGAVSSRQKVKTSSYGYKAPVEIHAVNASMTSMEVTWRTVTGSPGYVLRAQGGGKTFYQIGNDGSTVFKGLVPSTKYTFSVANRMPFPGYLKVPGAVLSSWSSHTSTKTTNSLTTAGGSAMAEAPTDLTMTDRDHESLSLSWTAPAGYDADKHEFRIDWAKDQEMTESVGSAYLAGTSGTIHKLSPNTNYYVRVRMMEVNTTTTPKTYATASDRTEAIIAKTRSPKGFITGTVTGVPSNVLTDYVVTAYSKSTGEATLQVNLASNGKYTLEVRPGDYYVQVLYVGSGNYTSTWVHADGSAGLARSEASPVTVLLSRVPTVATGAVVSGGSTIKGTVTNSSGAAVRDVYVAAIYKGDVLQQGKTDSSGGYTMKGLPEGAYTVRFNPSAGGYASTNSSATVTGLGQTVDVDKKLS